MTFAARQSAPKAGQLFFGKPLIYRYLQLILNQQRVLKFVEVYGIVYSYEEVSVTNLTTASRV